MHYGLRLFAALSLIIIPVAGCNGNDGSGAANSTTGEPAGALLSVATRVGTRQFTVEIADTPDQQQKGLMFRTSLANDRGMIFPILPPRHVSFWMKNTLIPLDMIFIRPDGTIARIEENTVPESLDVVQSGEPVIAVFEIPGGQSAAQGIKPGDKVTLPF